MMTRAAPGKSAAKLSNCANDRWGRLRIETRSLCGDLYDACTKGQAERAQELQDKASHLRQIFKAEYPAPIKDAMEIMGRPVGPTHLPIRPLSEDGKKCLLEELRKLGVLEQESRGW